MGIRDITLGQFVPRNSVIHRLDPRTKLLSCLVLMVFFILSDRLPVLLTYFVLVLTLYWVARLNPMIAFRNLKPFVWLFLLTFILHAFFTKGTIVMTVPYTSVRITEEGLLKGAFYSLRISIFILLASLLTLTTSPMSLTDAVERFLKPFRRFGVPSHEIALMMSISIRFIPIFIEEGERIRKAQLSRGGSFQGNIIKRIRNVIPLIIPLFVSTFRRANDLALAMDARCYTGGEGRTSYHVLRFRWIDTVAFFLIVLIGVPAVLYR